MNQTAKNISLLLENLSQHLVALFIKYRVIENSGKTNKLKIFSCSGTILNIRDEYYFLTAGHSLQQLDTYIQKGRIDVVSAYLIDTFKSNLKSKLSIPFDFINEPKFYINNDKEGLDFGVIKLRYHYIKLLNENGIVAIFEKNWIHQHNVKYNMYCMLGLPEECISPSVSDSNEDSIQFVKVKSILIFVEYLENPPDNIERTRYPRFMGKLHPKFSLSSISGMSGCPIFGLFGNPLKYHIVAIQSSWIREKRITFGCPIPTLANLMTQIIDNINDN